MSPFHYSWNLTISGNLCKMQNIVFLKELLAVIGSVTAILAVIGGIAIWAIKTSFKRGKAFQLFESLVEKVTSIERIIEDKFSDNDARHKTNEGKIQVHDTRITKLEVKTDVKNDNKKSKIPAKG